MANNEKQINKKIDDELIEINPAIDHDFFLYYETRDKKLRDELVKRNQPLVTYIVSKYYSTKKEHQLLREDLLQEGMIGLMSAIEKYKPELGFRFSTYSSYWIRQAINNYLLYVNPTIHVPSHIRTANNKLSKKLKEENISYQTYIENYHNTDYSDKMLTSMNCANKVRFVSSIDEPVNANGSSNIGTTNNPILKDILREQNEKQLDVQFDSVKMIEMVKESLSSLPPKELYVLLLRFDIISKIPNAIKRKK